MNRLIILAIASSLLFVSCQQDDDTENPNETPNSAKARTYDGTFLQEYIKLSCTITQTTDGFLPPQAARAYGYIGVAAYESVIYGINPAYRLEGQLEGFNEGSIPDPVSGEKYNWALACNAATAHMMRRMFGENITTENLELINSMEDNTFESYSIGVTADVVNRSLAYGEDVAESIYLISQSDGGHESYIDPFQLPYELEVDDYCWVPTDDVNQNPVSPFWMNNRSFISGSTEASQVGAHLPFSTEESSEFYGQAMDVYNQVTNLNSNEHRTIAEYWADDPFATCTPSGHTFNILSQLLGESDATLEKTAVGIAMMSVAENDAFISCWKSKYDYILLRPVTYIQQYIDADFETVIGTPPFPAYTSGHSAEIGAGAKVLIHLFSDESGDYTFTDLSQLQYGFSARSFDNFYDMANECALSRYYGGIHYEMDNSKGLELGFAIGDAVVNEVSWPQNIQ
ncbi:MAG TPA: vanadium-dependent haloperoxidase [Cryomorphaceae bacterium]|nr:vanadium-dependent haloperoxidase [Cryomorphaceae bacterium]